MHFPASAEKPNFMEKEIDMRRILIECKLAYSKYATRQFQGNHKENAEKFLPVFFVLAQFFGDDITRQAFWQEYFQSIFFLLFYCLLESEQIGPQRTFIVGGLENAFISIPLVGVAEYQEWHLLNCALHSEAVPVRIKNSAAFDGMQM